MSNSIIAEGKTTNEAIENGLKQLNATKDMVEIKVLENEEKRSFFSILAPRVIKVEITLKEEQRKEIKKEKTYNANEKDLTLAADRIKTFLTQFVEKSNIENAEISVEIEKDNINVSLNGDNINYLIGYRGETLNAMQVIVSAIANKGLEQRCKVLLDMEGYRARREKTLEELAEKISKTVVRTKKAITLEPMSAYERKIIHSRLQNNSRVKTYSIGEEPNRKVVITLK